MPYPMPTRPDALTIEDLRVLVRSCDYQPESFWLPGGRPALTLAEILAVWHAAQAAGFPGLIEWWEENATEARAAWLAIVDTTQAAGQRTALCPERPARACSPDCPGWAVFNVGTEDEAIQRCDECGHYPDDDAAQDHVGSCEICSASAAAQVAEVITP